MCDGCGSTWSDPTRTGPIHPLVQRYNHCDKCRWWCCDGYTIGKGYGEWVGCPKCEPGLWN